MEKCDDGQHRATPGSVTPDNGQRQVMDKGVRVGQASGGEQAMSVPAPARDALVKTEHSQR